MSAENYVPFSHYVTIKLLLANSGDIIDYSNKDNYLYFDLTDNENDPDYVFTYKLTKLFPAMEKLAENYGKEVLKFGLGIYQFRKKTGVRLRYGFNQIIMMLYNYEKKRNFIHDIIQIISYVCGNHNRTLGVFYETMDFPSYITNLSSDYQYSELNVISEQDAKQLFEEFNYAKVIPFNMRYCLRENIKLPIKIKILVKLFGYDIAGEIAKYLYVICGK